MAWLIGAIAIVVAIFFWRIFLPIAIVAGIALFFFIRSDQERFRQGELRRAEEQASIARQKADQKAAELALRERIAQAQRQARPQGKGWQSEAAPDPASGVSTVRSVQVASDDGLCRLTASWALDGVERFAVSCPGLDMPQDDLFAVKFENEDVARSTYLGDYSALIRRVGYMGPSVGLSRSQSGAWLPDGNVRSYDEWIAGLRTAKAVAVRIPVAGGFWTRFGIEGGAQALALLGKPDTQQAGTVE